MRYHTFQGKTQKEAFDQLNQAKRLDPAFKEVRLVTHNEKKIPSLMGLKTQTVYEIMVAIPELPMPVSTFSLTEEPKPLSSIEKNILQQSAKKAKTAKQNVEETLFAIESVSRVAEKISQLEKKDPITRPTAPKAPTISKAAPKNVEFESLQSELSYMKQEFQNMKSLLSTHMKNAQTDLFHHEISQERSLPNDLEICKQHIRWVEQFLAEKDFSRFFITNFIESIEDSSEILKDKTLIINAAKDFLKAHIPHQNINLDDYQFGSNIVFVGSTGVGKTSSLIKFAAHLGLARRKKFRFVSLDNHKLSNDSQLETLSNYMKSPYFSASKEESFLDIINSQEIIYDYTLIDTAGLSPKEKIAIEEIAHWIHKIEQKVDVHLVVSATTKASDLEMIFEQYSCLNINHILVSKMDETATIGSILSLAYKYKKPLSFLTDGQEIPQDFKIADINRLIHDSLC
ncbi:MAG: hypothetical protein ACRCS8_05350 [Brevinema sp.]